MKGFTSISNRALTFTRGDESVTYTVYPLPPLFMPMVRTATGATNTDPLTINARALIMAAEALRPSEDIPAHPSAKASSEEWMSYAASLSQMFQDAGLTAKQINAIAVAADEMADFVTEALDEVGNG